MRRRGAKYHVRMFLGRLAQKLAWRLSDPYDAWVLEYEDDDGHRYGATCDGPYSMARIRARELRGRIIGYRGTVIPACIVLALSLLLPACTPTPPSPIYPQGLSASDEVWAMTHSKWPGPFVITRGSTNNGAFP